MRILAIETSCDDTSIALIEGNPLVQPLSFTVHAHVTSSQKIHAEYGGVYPAKAKEKHVEVIVPLILKALHSLVVPHHGQPEAVSLRLNLAQHFTHEPPLVDAIWGLFAQYPVAPIDAIAVTYGPGLEPCLWVGVNVARALTMQWNIPLIPINHMEGHTLSALFSKEKPTSNHAVLKPLAYPSLALLISGGHTQLVLLKAPLRYEIVGTTVDDAVGEAYDKVGRMLDLPYPGGPQVAALADEYRDAFRNRDSLLKNLFPRPMLHSGNFNFSFSGLKTSVMYYIRDMQRSVLDRTDKQRLSYAFESALSEVLAEKTRTAIQQLGVKALLLGGGVACNRHLRRKFTHVTNDEHVDLYLPEFEITTDNALMIALAAFYRLSLIPLQELAVDPLQVKANGNLKLE